MLNCFWRVTKTLLRYRPCTGNCYAAFAFSSTISTTRVLLGAAGWDLLSVISSTHAKEVPATVLEFSHLMGILRNTPWRGRRSCDTNVSSNMLMEAIVPKERQPA